MDMTLERFGLDKVDSDVKRRVMELLGESLADEAPLTPGQLAEIQRRTALLDADPTRVVSWEVALEAARARSRVRWGK